MLVDQKEEKTMGDFNSGGGFGPREMHNATCSECGQECQVPFKPIQDKAVYCKECFMKRKAA